MAVGRSRIYISSNNIYIPLYIISFYIYTQIKIYILCDILGIHCQIKFAKLYITYNVQSSMWQNHVSEPCEPK